MNNEEKDISPLLLSMTKDWVSKNKLECPNCGESKIVLYHGFERGREVAKLLCENCSEESLKAESSVEEMKLALDSFTNEYDEPHDGIKMLLDELENQDTCCGEMSCNDNISQFMDDEGITPETVIDNVTDAFQGVLDALLIDTDNDHNTQDTARRVAKMYVNEIFRGRYYPMPKITAFPNAKNYDQIYTVGPITIRGTCAHHFQGIVGKCWIGIKPSENVIGLSKFNRLVDWVASRPSIQEEMTEQIADLIEEITGAKGIAVIVKAEHLCMTHRGVKEHESEMTTSVMRGEFRKEASLKAEFLSLIDMK